MKITVLVENTARHGLLAEHGLSLWIETPDSNVLFDTGQGQALPHNVARLTIPLEQAAAVVLSHGHYDHTGGLGCFLDQNRKASLFLHPDVLNPRFSRHADQQMHSIGMPSGIASVLRTLPDRIAWTTQPLEIVEGLWATGPIPRETSFEDTGGDFFLDAKATIPDVIPDDQALWMETPQGLVIALGCAHSGAVNTLDHVSKLTGSRTFHAVIGGMHLARASEMRLEETARALEYRRVQHIVPGHCTGENAVRFLRQRLPGRVAECAAGRVLVFNGE